MANADVFKSMSQKPGMSSEDIYGKVSTAPSQTVTGAVQPGAGGPGGSTTTTGAFQAAPTASAPAEPAEVGRFAGSGNYEYAKMSDGSIKITKSTRGGAGTVVAEDSPFYDLIMTDIEKFSKPAAKPAAPKAASKKPFPAGDAMEGDTITAPGTSFDDPRMGETEGDMVGDAMLDLPSSEAGAPAPKAKADFTAQAREVYAAKKYGGTLNTEARLGLISRAADSFVANNAMPLQQATATAKMLADAGSFAALEAIASQNLRPSETKMRAKTRTAM
jgi:hypothetical protein